MTLLTERYAEKIQGVLECFDRIVMQGTLPGLCFAEGMTTYLRVHQIRIFDYPRFAEPLRDQIRENAERLAAENGLTIEFLRRADIRKEDRIAAILKQRGEHPGLVHILSAMETCPTYKPWHDKQTGKTYLKPDQGKCLHYYFYFIDAELGLGYVRVPTWCPFRLQVYFNGHNWLAAQLRKKKIDFTLLDNAFYHIADWKKAQPLATSFDVEKLHRKLDTLARRFCPVTEDLGVTYHWSLMQVEYATDIVFTQPSDLQLLYGTLTRTAIHTVKPDNVATFLGRKLTGHYQGEVGNHFHTRIEGTRIKHHMGPVAIKMYDKFGQILRIETTTHDVSFFKHYRQVEHRDGTKHLAWAAMKKSIYSLPPLGTLLSGANQRYLEFLSALDDPSDGLRKLNRVCQPVTEDERNYKGFNFFDDADQQLFETIARGEFTLRGFQNKHLRRFLSDKTSAQVSHLLKRLRLHGLIKKVRSSYKYYLTQLGKQVTAAGLKLKQLVLLPEFASQAASA